ncbi:hypothetical protein GGR54DRAFT_590352 [Hypoxylon sp. NC1633]|nr:hypothetical protein GGR54DRAFT_590352 [Hypoxylon sp. NC1633]
MPPRRPHSDLGDEMWEKNKPVICQLFQVERKTLKQVKHIMETEHGFPTIPLSTYETKLRDKLGLRKKLKKSDWSAVYQSYLKRNGKDTAVYLNGSKIPWNKAWKEIRRSGARSTSEGEECRLPSGVIMRTPSPAAHLSPPYFPAVRDQPQELISMQLTPVTSRALAHNLPSHLSQGTTFFWDPTSLYGENTRYVAALQAASASLELALRDLPSVLFRETMLPTAVAALHAIIGADLGMTFHKMNHSKFPLARVSGSDENVTTGVPTLNVDIYYYLSRVIYSASNKSAEFSEIDILLNRVPRSILLALFQSGIPTARATWEYVIHWTGRQGCRESFIFLINAGLQHPGWVFKRGSLYLAVAAAMGELQTVRLLLKAGVRTDRGLHGHLGDSAILQAAATGSIDCVEMLLGKCDVNRVVFRSINGGKMTIFGKFLSSLAAGFFLSNTTRAHAYPPESFKKLRSGIYRVELTLDNELHSRALDLLLQAGADVNQLWKEYDPNSALSRFYRSVVPKDWRPTLLEQSYYWNKELYARLIPYNTRSTKRMIRSDICLSAKQGGQILREHLLPQPTKPGFDQRKFLEVVLVEQFLTKDMDFEVIRGLNEYGVDPTLPSLPLDRNHLLYCLVVRSRTHGYDEDFATILTLLLGFGMVIDSEILEAAVDDEGVEVLEALSQQGADVRKHGVLALCTAARLNNYNAVSWLLREGVNINATANMIFPVDYSFQPAETLTTKPEPWSVLAISCNTGLLPTWGRHYINDRRPTRTASCDMLQYLISCGAVVKNVLIDPDPLDFLYRLLLTSGYDTALLDKIQFFLDLQYDCQGLLAFGACLLDACLNSRLHYERDIKQRMAVFELLVERGAPIRESHVLPSLICYGGRRELIFELLRFGINVDAYTTEFPFFSLTPIEAAARRGDKGLLIQLMQKGASISGPRSGGKSVLEYACDWRPQSAKKKADKLDLVQFLIENGAEINPPYLDNRTPLQRATALGDMELVILLVHHGAKPNLPFMEKRYSELDLAAFHGKIDVAKFLLNIGALSTNRGDTGYDGAIRLAKVVGHFAVADLILQHAENEVKLYGTNLAMSFEEPVCESGKNDHVEKADQRPRTFPRAYNYRH